MAEVAAQPIPRRGRLWVLGVLAVGIFALGYSIVNIATQKGGKPVIKIAGISETQEIFGGVEQAGDRLGSPSAPVAIQVFNDLQCAPCRQPFVSVMPGLVERFVRSGDVKLLYRHYSVGENPTEVGFFDAEAAAQQGDGWQYTYLFFRNQEEAKRQNLDKGFFVSIANSVEEMNVPKWERDLEQHGGSGGSIAKRLASYEKLGTDLGIRAQEAMIVTGPNGSRTLQEGPTLQQIEAAIAAVR
jgi:protein-disulfide isomerase